MPVSSVIRPGDDKDNPVARKNSDSVGITGKLEIYLTNQASVETDDVCADNTREERVKVREKKIFIASSSIHSASDGVTHENFSSLKTY